MIIQIRVERKNSDIGKRIFCKKWTTIFKQNPYRERVLSFFLSLSISQFFCRSINRYFTNMFYVFCIDISISFFTSYNQSSFLKTPRNIVLKKPSIITTNIHVFRPFAKHSFVMTLAHHSLRVTHHSDNKTLLSRQWLLIRRMFQCIPSD